jgi:CBS domain-containing protein
VLKVKDIMTEGVLTILSTITAAQAIALMQAKKIRSLPLTSSSSLGRITKSRACDAYGLYA